MGRRAHGDIRYPVYFGDQVKDQQMGGSTRFPPNSALAEHSKRRPAGSRSRGAVHPCRWLSEPCAYPARDAGRVAFASVGPGRQRGLNRAADAELMLLFRWSVAGLIPQPMRLLDHHSQHLGIHPAIRSQPPCQLRQQVAGLSPWRVSEPPRCLLLAHSDVQQLGDGTPDSVGCGVVAVHIEQRRDVARPQPFSLPHLVVRAGQCRNRITRWCRQAGPLSPVRECRRSTANRTPARWPQSRTFTSHSQHAAPSGGSAWNAGRTRTGIVQLFTVVTTANTARRRPECVHGGSAAPRLIARMPLPPGLRAAGRSPPSI